MVWAAVVVQSLTIIAAGRIMNVSPFSTMSRRNLQIPPRGVEVVLANGATTWTSTISNAMKDSRLSGTRSRDSKIAEIGRSSWI